MRPPLTIGALQAGEIDYAFGASTISRGSISGAPVRLVSLSLLTSFHTLVARPQFKSIADLRGKTVAVTIGAADDFVARHLIRRAGFEPRDYAFVNMGGSDTRFPALHAGSIDATALSLPFFIVAKRQGFTLLGSASDVIDMAKAADAPFKNARITPLSGFGDRAFVVEAVTDPKTNYKSALIVFYKGRAGGTVSAWKKPQSSLETTKTVLRHILSKLP